MEVLHKSTSATVEALSINGCYPKVVNHCKRKIIKVSRFLNDEFIQILSQEQSELEDSINEYIEMFSNSTIQKPNPRFRLNREVIEQVNKLAERLNRGQNLLLGFLLFAISNKIEVTEKESVI